MSQVSINKIFTALLLVLVIGFGLGFVGGRFSEADHLLKGKVLDKQVVADKVKAFIKDNFLSKTDKIEIPDIQEENNLYVLKTKINGQEQNFYVTKDGALFFPQMLDLNPPADRSFPKTDKPSVDLYVMSFCPYGNNAEDQMKPVIDALGDKINFHLHYIIYSNYQGEDYCLTEDMKYCSMHTASEVKEDIRELCVAKYQPDKLWDFVLKVNTDTNATKVEKDWEGIAEKVGLDVDKVKTCQKEEGTKLLDQEMALTNKTYPVEKPRAHRASSGHYQTAIKIQGSPTLVINGMIYDGKTSVADYQEAICSAFNNPPAACQKALGEAKNNPSSGVCQ